MMMDAIFSRGGRAALLLGSLVLGCALVVLQRIGLDDYDPWAVD